MKRIIGAVVVLAIFVAALVAVQSVAASVQLSITDLGMLPGGTFSRAG